MSQTAQTSLDRAGYPLCQMEGVRIRHAESSRPTLKGLTGEVETSEAPDVTVIADAT